jgi:aspartate-semialdehyde dehydrogenase
VLKVARIPVAVVGATGMVGQRIIAMLEDHPQFELAEVASSARTAGKRYGAAATWRVPTAMPDGVADLQLKEGGSPLDCGVVFSAMPGGPATAIERTYAAAGKIVVSNSSSYRMDPRVPLVIPEVNADHLRLVRSQDTPGGIVTNCNCAAMFLTMALAPLHRRWGVQAVQATTMQAVSGAGYPGVASLDILGNVFPLPAEEEKMERETQKMLGTVADGVVAPATFPVSAQCQRVPVEDGHTETVSVRLAGDPDPGEVADALREFRGMPQEHGLYSAPPRPIEVFEQDDRPQPRLDANRHGGMAASVGRIRACPVFTVKMLVLGHNLMRGAAAAAMLNAEAMLAMDLLPARRAAATTRHPKPSAAGIEAVEKVPTRA